MNDNLKEKSDYIVKSIKNKIIREKLDICFYEWNYATLELTTEDCCVAITSEIIADAWISEIDKIKTMFALS
jgi:hypothetical protein